MVHTWEVVAVLWANSSPGMVAAMGCRLAMGQLFQLSIDSLDALFVEG